MSALCSEADMPCSDRAVVLPPDPYRTQRQEMGGAVVSRTSCPSNQCNGANRTQRQEMGICP
jgi:hypothetical protein